MIITAGLGAAIVSTAIFVPVAEWGTTTAILGILAA